MHPRLLRFTVLLIVCPISLLSAQSLEPRQQLYRYIDGVAHSHLESRRQTIVRLQTRMDADRRRLEVREKILRLIGGLPERHGPVATKEFGTLSGDGFRVEKIAYESLSGFWVTANLYVSAAGAAEGSDAGGIHIIARDEIDAGIANTPAAGYSGTHRFDAATRLGPA
jgi:hypothetical protein